MEGQFSTRTVKGLTGASLRQLDYWTGKMGLLRPSGKAPSGKGTRRRFTFRDVVALKTITALRERKCPLQKIRKAVTYLRGHYPSESNAEMLARLTLLTDGKRVYLLTEQREIMEVVTRQHVWSVAVGQIIQEACEQVKKLPSEWVKDVVVAGKTYHLWVVQDSETGTYTTQCKELPGAIEQGDTAEEAVENGTTAIRSALEFIQKRKHLARARRVAAG